MVTKAGSFLPGPPGPQPSGMWLLQRGWAGLRSLPVPVSPTWGAGAPRVPSCPRVPAWGGGVPWGTAVGQAGSGHSPGHGDFARARVAGDTFWGTRVPLGVGSRGGTGAPCKALGCSEGAGGSPPGRALPHSPGADTAARPTHASPTPPTSAPRPPAPQPASAAPRPCPGPPAVPPGQPEPAGPLRAAPARSSRRIPPHPAAAHPRPRPARRGGTGAAPRPPLGAARCCWRSRCCRCCPPVLAAGGAERRARPRLPWRRGGTREAAPVKRSRGSPRGSAPAGLSRLTPFPRRATALPPCAPRVPPCAIPVPPVGVSPHCHPAPVPPCLCPRVTPVPPTPFPGVPASYLMSLRGSPAVATLVPPLGQPWATRHCVTSESSPGRVPSMPPPLPPCLCSARPCPHLCPLTPGPGHVVTCLPWHLPPSPPGAPLPPPHPGHPRPSHHPPLSRSRHVRSCIPSVLPPLPPSVCLSVVSHSHPSCPHPSSQPLICSASHPSVCPSPIHLSIIHPSVHHPSICPSPICLSVTHPSVALQPQLHPSSHLLSRLSVAPPIQLPVTCTACFLPALLPSPALPSAQLSICPSLQFSFTQPSIRLSFSPVVLHPASHLSLSPAVPHLAFLPPVPSRTPPPHHPSLPTLGLAGGIRPVPLPPPIPGSPQTGGHRHPLVGLSPQDPQQTLHPLPPLAQLPGGPWLG